MTRPDEVVYQIDMSKSVTICMKIENMFQKKKTK